MPQAKERLLHHVIISVFCKAYERPEEVLAGLDRLSPVPSADLLALEKEYDPERPHTVHYRGKDITLTVQEMPSDDGTMFIYTLFFRRMHWTSEFAKALRETMTSTQREAYANDPSSILGEDGRLSVRFDKRDLMRGKLSLVNTGDCYAVKASVAAYPKTLERVEATVKKILS